MVLIPNSGHGTTIMIAHNGSSSSSSSSSLSTSLLPEEAGMELQSSRDDNDRKKIGTIHIATTPQEELSSSSSSSSSIRDEDNDDEEDRHEKVELEPCPVILESFQNLSPERQAQWRDKVQSFRFTDFDGLEEFMTPLKDKILKRHPATLRLVHEKFQDILQEVVETKGLGASLIRAEGEDECIASSSCSSHSSSSSSSSWSSTVAPFATPNVRLKRGTYATFLHADAVFHPLPTNSTTTSTTTTRSTSAPRAMMNVWMSLADAPIANFPLAFYDCPRSNTRFGENKLYYCSKTNKKHNNGDAGAGTGADEELRMLYDPTLQWGSFLCFVAGQPASSDRVILHGAVHLEESSSSPSSTTNHSSTTIRQQEQQQEQMRMAGQRIMRGRSRGKSKRPMTTTLLTATGPVGRHCFHEDARKSLEMRFLL